MTSQVTTRVLNWVKPGWLSLLGLVVVASFSSGQVRAQDALLLCQSDSGKLRAAASCRPNEIETDILTLFLKPQDARFSIMWRNIDGTTDSAAIREGASIRSSTDAALSVVKLGVGQYCLTTSPGSLEGAVGVLQRSITPVGVIRVTAGIAGGPACPPGTDYVVETFGF